MAHRKWKESKQQPKMLPGPAVPGCCLVSFCFLCDIHSVQSYLARAQTHREGKVIGTIFQPPPRCKFTQSPHVNRRGATTRNHATSFAIHATSFAFCGDVPTVFAPK